MTKEEGDHMILDAIQKIADGQSLTQIEARGAMQDIMAGEATPAQISGFIMGLRVKGETVDEITGCAEAMRERAFRINPTPRLLVDTCGTGGDGANTFNISTASAFVAAGAGVPIAKHGNRSVSSRCGSADVLEALGVRIDLPPAQVEACIDAVGIGFLFAPQFHASMKHAGGPRKELGIRTIFNLLGPLTNPASAHAQVVGVYAPHLTRPIAEVLGRLGLKEAFVVHGLDRIDEISVCGETQVSHLKGGAVETYVVHPGDLGLEIADRSEISGGDAAYNAELVRGVLAGEKGPRRDVVLLNAGAAIVVAGHAGNLAEGVSLAAEAIDGGHAAGKLKALIEYTQGAAA